MSKGIKILLLLFFTSKLIASPNMGTVVKIVIVVITILAICYGLWFQK